MNDAATDQTNAQTGASQAPSNQTPGWQTTEFWMTLLGHVGLVSAAASGALPAKYAAAAAALSQVAYNLARGLAKANR